MRITNGMSINGFLRNMENSQERMTKYSDQISTGQRITRLGDDPIGVVKSMTARQNLARYKQYAGTVGDAKLWVDTAETAMREISNSLASIKELTTQAATGTNSDTDKANIAKEVEQLVDHILQTANTTVNGEYIFGGNNISSPPFARPAGGGNVLYNGMDLSDPASIPPGQLTGESNQHIDFDVGYDINMPVSVNGVELVGTGTNNIFSMLDDLVTEMSNGGSSEKLTAMLGDLTKAHDAVLFNVVGMGSQMTRIEMLENRYSQDVIDATGIKSNIEDVAQGEAIMNLKMSEAIYRQALAAGARIIKPALADFLN